MKIAYIKDGPFGEFFYDPISLQGVSIPEEPSRNPVVIRMRSDFDPYKQSDIKEIDVEEDVFNELLGAGRERNRLNALSIYMSHLHNKIYSDSTV